MQFCLDVHAEPWSLNLRSGTQTSNFARINPFLQVLAVRNLKLRQESAGKGAVKAGWIKSARLPELLSDIIFDITLNSMHRLDAHERKLR